MNESLDIHVLFLDIGVVFCQDRAFAREQFKDYMFRQLQPIDDDIEAIKRIAKANGLRVCAINNNEGRELAIRSIHHESLDKTVRTPADMGLDMPQACEHGQPGPAHRDRAKIAFHVAGT